MTGRLRSRLILLGAAVCAIAVAAGVYWLRVRGPVAPADLVALLPTENASVVYIDVDTLRRAGILDMLAGSKAAEDPDYRKFVKDTQFDYRNDLDAVAASFQKGKTYFAVRGRFHWKNIEQYAAGQGGSCHREYCVVTGSQPNRRISFYLVKPHVLAMAVSPEDFAAYQVTDHPGKLNLSPPKDPVWALIPAAQLQTMSALPDAAKAYLPALQSADQIVFSVGPDHDRQLELGIHVTCKDSPAAAALVSQFDATTKALRDLLASQHKTPEPSDLSGVLIAGNFRQDDRQVFGTWPIPQAFLHAVAGNAY